MTSQLKKPELLQEADAERERANILEKLMYSNLGKMSAAEYINLRSEIDESRDRAKDLTYKAMRDVMVEIDAPKEALRIAQQKAKATLDKLEDINKALLITAAFLRVTTLILKAINDGGVAIVGSLLKEIENLTDLAAR